MHLPLFISIAQSLWVVGAAVTRQSQHPLVAADHSLPVLNEQLDAAILDILRQFKTPGGIGVAVVSKTPSGAWQLESKGYGNATKDKQVTADTLFAIGSNSKLFDIIATGLLISNESLTPRISWTSKIASLIPEWKLMDPVASGESTIIDLMSHRTGLPRHDFMAPLNAHPRDMILNLRHLRPSTGFREQLQYNNHMYATLSYLPESILGIPYEHYVEENIFSPIGMLDTTFFYADAVKNGNLATSFYREQANMTKDPFDHGQTREFEFWDRSESGHAASGAGGVISSARDMARWMQVLLAEGTNTANESIIPPEILRKVSEGITVIRPTAAFPELSPVVYGGGQMRSTYRGFEIIEHGGSTPGFKAQVSRIPTKNLGVVVLSNEENLGGMLQEAVKFRIFDEVLKLDPIDWTDRYRSAVANSISPDPIPRSPDAKPPSVPYASLAGRYSNAAYRDLDFCLFWMDETTGDVCHSLRKEITQRLPNVLDPNVPTLVSRFDSIISNYLQMSHFAGNMFNLTALFSNTVNDDTWVLKVPGLRAEFEAVDGIIGFAPIDIWGAGDRVPASLGETVKERAEVWFDKV